ncbi:type II toxin-antitoxin system RelB family antitoxin [Breznakia pachnodae]|uniref:Uncharacterized protein (DUF1778 family) n=1 Tax=Breznakia pachnodae TaxID=265178 RepID=A0ABU0E2N7_9FIRM|nr:DUF6290 family protein [Breznakia pachnodae]MDQ0361149.1 uncharacterized protein (DUF1778 family) [Breznakia pachnodae]
MDKNISIKVTKYEQDLIQKSANSHNMNVSDFIKKIIFEIIEDDYDIQLADKRYLEHLRKANTKEHTDLMKELDI